MALDGKTPDQRRKGVEGLAASADAGADWAIKVFDTIARTDSDSMTRCAAVRGLQKSADARTVATALKLLVGTDARTEDVRPVPDVVRWQAAKLLLDIVDRYGYDEKQREPIVQVLIDRVQKDPDRNVRLTCIDTLAYFAEQPIPTVLVGVMETGDFAVQHAAEESLMSLTGQTFHHDAEAWKEWLASTADPFEHAGEHPPDVAGSEAKPWWKWQ